MKKKYLIFFILAAVLALVGCKKKNTVSETDMYAAANHKIEVDSEGGISETLVEKFEKDYYSKDELTAFVDEEIAEYNKTAGNDKVKKNGLEKSGNEITLEMKYASADDYTAFNDAILFVGTISQAISAGYDFDTVFDGIIKGKVETQSVKADVIKALGTDYSVVITNQDIGVMTPSNIVYISQNVKIAGKQTARVDDENLTAKSVTTTDATAAPNETDENNVAESQQNLAETTNKIPAYIIYK